MTTITINEKTKAGKTLLELAKLLAVTNKGVKIEEDESPYNPEFVAEIQKRYADYKSGKSKTITVDPNDIWGSLGLK
ncbi:hypothetical protein SAMN05444671_3467 [Flavobacterium sp. CF108]|uniref:DUF2683 family protein n=1 Tax=unclassified Flavobacterium TaxID=196869 RepID=UPI0008CF0760|nr:MULTISPECIES: DUF2683 family protein [unclassified Flavobacterium]SEO44720.1 hypothetical protein SAMN04487978_2901 [Flavobacterium sp. fv08]SHH69424.1 hypothetical protein SAMN05444671_3467 [Flavobacterium sp. CF108]